MSLQPATPYGSTDLVEVLDRVLDKGMVVTGDISISVANLELLGLRMRLLLTSIDRAEELGMDMSWTGLDRARALPTGKGHSLAREPEVRALGAPPVERAMGAREGEKEQGSASETETLELASAALEGLHYRLSQIEQRIAQRIDRQAAAPPPRRPSS
jgi:hypothetical protein